jgi:release factor glutamine methyltransferase
LTIKKILKKYHSIEIDLLLAFVLRKSKEFLFMNSGYSLSANQLISLSALVKRRLRGEPMAYILGYKDFYGLGFKVNRSVLIPRPETEWVVDRVIARSQATKQSNQRKRLPRPSAALGVRNDTLKILDLGTGSGCIIISLAKALSAKRLGLRVKLYASDISSAALKVAKQNAKDHTHTSTYECGVKFVRSDLLNGIKINPDIIIANLPYGWSEWKNNTSAETKGLKFEPKKALFTGENGLKSIRRLLQQIAGLKQKPKLVYLEFDPRQKFAIWALIKKFLPGSKVKFYKDYNNFWRYVEIKLK